MKRVGLLDDSVRWTVTLIAMTVVLFAVSVRAFAHAAPIDQIPVSAATAQQQLHALVREVELYYPYLKTPAERTRFNTRAGHLAESVHRAIPTWRNWELQQKLLRTLDDPHAELGTSMLEDRALAVELRWVSDGPLISPAPWMHPALFPKNSELVRIGGETPAELLQRLEALYAGTPGWVAHRSGFMLRYAFELRWLGLLQSDGRVPVVIRTPAGHIKRLNIATTALPDFRTLEKRQRKKPWFSWSIDKAHNVGWFTLNSMRLTGPYEQAVTAFFKAVEQSGITRVAVDLRHNGGGESLAEAPFMQYLGVDRIQDYAVQTRFDHAHLAQEVKALVAGLKRVGIQSAEWLKIPVPPQPEASRIFQGRLYIVTGPGSFSSAMEFAADVKFNHLGTIVGLPCGEEVTGPGDVRWFAHPASGIPFQVPTDTNVWPGLPAHALVEPDVTIRLTVHDVQRGIDPVRAWFDGVDVARK